MVETTDTVTRPEIEHAAPLADAGAVRGEDVLVAIPVLNEAAHIEDCLKSLFAGDGRIRKAKVVVIDGGSNDGTRDIVKRLSRQYRNLELVNNPRRVQSAGVNLAVRAHGEVRSILVRCDAHAVYPENYVMDVADSLRANGVASIATPMDARGDTCFQKANAYIVDTPLGSGGSAHRGGRQSGFVDHGHHAGFDLGWFNRVGGYDASFTHNEDAEYDRRLTDAGGRIYLDADIRIGYYPRATVRSLARQYYNYGKGRARNLKKHGGWPRLRQLIPPLVFLACLMAIALSPVSGWTLLLPAGYIAALAAASLAVAFSMGSACGLLAGVASFTMHMAWSAGFLRQFLFAPKDRAAIQGIAPEAG